MQVYFEQRARNVIVASTQDCFWELMFQKYKTFSAYLASPSGQSANSKSSNKQQIEPSIRSTGSRHHKENQTHNKENKKVVEQNAVAKPIRRQLATPQKLVQLETTSRAIVTSTMKVFI